VLKQSSVLGRSSSVCDAQKSTRSRVRGNGVYSVTRTFERTFFEGKTVPFSRPSLKTCVPKRALTVSASSTPTPALLQNLPVNKAAALAVATILSYAAQKKPETYVEKAINAFRGLLDNLLPAPSTPVLANAAGAASVPFPEGVKQTNPLKKLIPLGSMFFLILFNYTILRDTKDVLVVTAPKSGAECIPFLKTWVVVPGAIGYAISYAKLANVLPRETLFYVAIAPFLLFFGTFSILLYPNRDLLHPNAFCDWLQTFLPASFNGPLGIIRNWTYALFYVLAELWGSVVVSLLFWGFANDVTTVEEAKKYYPLFGLGANVALILSGRVVKILSVLRENLPAGVDKWGISLNYMMACVLGCGLALVGIYWWMNRAVLTDPTLYNPRKQKETKEKLNMTIGESAKFLSDSKYIRNLATLVIAYGMSINLVEVTWKGKLKEQFPDPNAYSSFMGDFSSATGTVTFIMMLVGRFIFTRFGWGAAAMVTPTVLCLTGVSFFALIIFSNQLAPFTTGTLGLTPLYLAVLAGAAQNVASKSCKYSLFDPCKEMAYIPLDPESRTKGKAAIDVIGNPVGKSGGSLVQQILILFLGSLSACTPILAGVLGLTSFAWITAARSLAIDFKKKETKVKEPEKHQQMYQVHEAVDMDAKYKTGDTTVTNNDN